MFNLFGKNKKGPKAIDKVFISAGAKWEYCKKLHGENPSVIFMAWFEETVTAAENNLNRGPGKPATIVLVREAGHIQPPGATIIFLEHHPLRTAETGLMDKMGITEAVFLSSLDEPLFTAFGGEKIITLMKKLGMNENEPIEHQMISNAIRKAQEKTGKKVSIEQTARSQGGWLKKNTGF